MKVTVAIPFYNGAATLSGAVRSVFAQTCRDWELLLVDDGSADRSLEIAASVSDPRVRVISDGVHRGLVARLNQVARLARGRYIARMDADDLMHPERLQRQIEHLDRHATVDVLGTAIFTIDGAGRPVGIRADAPLDLTPRGVLLGTLLVHATVVARREWFQQHPYDPDYPRAEDHELWCRTFSSGSTRFDNLPDPLYFVREADSLTLRKVLASYRSDRRILRSYGPSLIGRPRTELHVAKTHLKGLTHALLAAIGRQRLLAGLRVRPLPPNRREAAQRALKTIRRTPVPGLLDHAGPNVRRRAAAA